MKNNLLNKIFQKGTKIGVGILIPISIALSSCSNDEPDYSNIDYYANLEEVEKGKFVSFLEKNLGYENNLEVCDNNKKLLIDYFICDSSKNVENFKLGNNPEDYIRIQTQDSLYFINKNKVTGKSLKNLKYVTTTDTTIINPLLEKYNKQMQREFYNLRKYNTQKIKSLYTK